MTMTLQDGSEIIVPSVGGIYDMELEPAGGGAIWEADVDLKNVDGPRGFVARALTGTRRSFRGNCFTGDLSLQDLLHQRLGHRSLASTHLSKRLCAVFGKNFTAKCTVKSCSACLRAKMTRDITRSPPTHPATRPLERIHFDYVSVPVDGVSGHSGFIIIVDEFTRKVWAELVRSKAEVGRKLEEFRVREEKHFQTQMGSFAYKLCGVRSDGGREQNNKIFAAWCLEHGIIQQLSAPYEQWQDGIAERAVRTTWEASEAARKHAGMPGRYWPYALQYAVDTAALLATGTSELSPSEHWSGVPVPLAQRIQHLRTLGARCYALIPKQQRSRLDDKCAICILMGYSPVSKAYICLELSTGRWITAVSVVFDETSYPFLQLVRLNRGEMLDKDKEAVIAATMTAWDNNVAGTKPNAPVGPGGVMEERNVNVLEEGAGGVAIDIEDIEDARGEDISVAGIDEAKYDGAGPARTGLQRADAVAPRILRRSSRQAEMITLREAIWDPAAPLPGGLPQMPDLEALQPPIPSSDDEVPVLGLHDELGASRAVEGGGGGAGDVVRGFEVEAVMGHRIGQTRRLDGTKEPYLVDQYRTSWVGYKQLSWLAASDFGDVARLGILADYQREHAPTINVHRNQHPGKILDHDYAPPVVASGLTAFSASLAPELPTLAPENLDIGPWTEAGVDRHGRVDIPQMDPDLDAKERIKVRLAGQSLDADGLRRISARIDIIALAAQVRGKAAGTTRQEPRGYAEALADGTEWGPAMDEEMASMARFGVWELVPLPPGKNAITCKWLNKIKRDENGAITRFKARLAARGFTQVEGKDYGQVWAPTCRMRVFRAMLAEASSDRAQRVIGTAAWDVTCAFLHAEMDKEVYMQQPRGYVQSGQEGMVCRLKKAIYGCKQASRLFHQQVRRALLGMGAVQADADECLFILRKRDAWIKVLVHVDDFAVTFSDRWLHDEIFGKMAEIFDIKNLGELRHFLGIAVQRCEDGSFRLSQEAYIDTILERVGMTGCQPALTPEAPGTKAKLVPLTRPLEGEDATMMAAVPYKEAVGALFYIARATRPEITHACGQVGRFMANPGPDHWQAVRRIYSYLAGTKATALVMRSVGMRVGMHDGRTGLEAYSDADWAGCPTTRRSHTGWLTMLGGSLVAWHSKRQGVVAQSSAEAEYVAAASAANELVWWRSLLVDFGYGMQVQEPVDLWCDNSAAVTMADHSGRFETTKHIEMRMHVLRDYQRRGLVMVQWLSAAHQLADIMTKSVSAKTFRQVVEQILGEPLRGRMSSSERL